MLMGMQLIDLAEERARNSGKGGGGVLLRHIHGVRSLADAVRAKPAFDAVARRVSEAAGGTPTAKPLAAEPGEEIKSSAA